MSVWLGLFFIDFTIHSFKNIFMKLSAIFFLLGTFFLLNSCNQLKPDDVVSSFYQSQIHSYDYRNADTSLLYKELRVKISEAKIKETKSVKYLKEINSTDKPDLIEGDIFTSNYEGTKSFKILSCELNENTANVKVEFTYQDLKWVDEIVVNQVNNKWLIADVIYGQSYLQGSLLKSLEKFNQEEMLIVGGDKDIHGCIGSAGYTWSQLKQTCIRSFELPIQLLNPEGTMTAGLLFSDNLSEAELFLPDGKLPLKQINPDKYKYFVDRKTVGILNKNNGKWEFFIVGSDVVYKQK
jgi:hypothetical protein